jgi:uncharacterized protein YciU (UPF0263 family)
MVDSINDWQKEHQFQVLNDKKDERGAKVIRNNIEKILDTCWKRADASHSKNESLVLIIWLYAKLETR